MNLPTFLTVSRIVLLPVIAALLFAPNEWSLWAPWLCLGLYILCALTDFLDGYFARKFEQVTAFGTFLDPISDKIFVGVLLIALIACGYLSGPWVIAAMVIITREFLISGLREYLGPKNVKLPVSNLAKWKTAFQMIALGFLVTGPALSFGVMAGNILLSLAALLTVITGWDYIKASIPHFKET